ncbi:thymidylate synthase [candidate division LCP-89 bacterium B3_LCP]|uniref:Thymidylate synthase n=1 Tax=candidate division LCP-89 bacterium B3_LCP TaxID=2012998 RepID=A0A532UPJ7_UNCL8|nr:MAG: thymidylate synthase [candidate division LCP-89 bacterium B3_LCP]
MLKLLIICSEPTDQPQRPGPFDRTFDTAWADRFIKHLKNDRTFCTGCGDSCIHCRDWRVTDFSNDIVKILYVPSLLPELLDDPAEYLPNKLPQHDVLAAIAIHEEILIELPEMINEAGGKSMIVPAEAPDWVSRWAKGKLKEASKKYEVEFAAPKPFCDLRFGIGPVTDEFIERFRIGYPQVEIEEDSGRIATATAKISAPCGNSHYVAHNLQGHSINDKLEFEVSHYWHAFPCTGSMKNDPELGGDTILHKGGQIHMNSFCRAAGVKRK